MRRFLIFISCLALLCGLIYGINWWESRGDGFRLYKIQSNLPIEDRWNISHTEGQYKEASEALKQPFSYLGHGFQCYAFESRDGKYVLKFFRHQRLRLPDFVTMIPSFPLFEEWRTTRILSLNKRREYLMRSCKTAQTFVPFETGLIYTHLNRSQGLFPSVIITDKLGNDYTIALDDYQFVLQYKAEHVKPTLLQLAQSQRFDEAKKRIDQLFSLLSDCAQKGIQDTDNALIYKNNLGFLDDRAIYIDGGKLSRNDSIRRKDKFVKDLNRLKPLLKWMKEKAPSLVPLYNEAQEEAILAFPETEITGPKTA